MELRIFAVTLVCVVLAGPTIATYGIRELDDAYVVDKDVVVSDDDAAGAVAVDNSVVIKDTLLQALLNHRRHRWMSCWTLCRISKCPHSCIFYYRPPRISLAAGFGNLLAAKAAAVKNVMSSVVSNTAAVVGNALELKSQALLLGAKTVSDILSAKASVLDSLVNPQVVQPNMEVVVKPNIQLVITKPVHQKPIILQPLVEKPIEYKPIEHKPIEYKPIEYKPIEYKPIEYKPIEHKPIEYKPIEYKPIIYKPDDIKPLHWKPVVLKPDEIKPFVLKPIEGHGRPTKYEIVVNNWPLLYSKYPELVPKLLPMSEKPQNPPLVQILSPVEANVTVPLFTSTWSGKPQNPLLLEIITPQQTNLMVHDKLSLSGTPVYTSEDQHKPHIDIQV